MATVKNLYIYCEGETEQMFVRQKIAPFFGAKGVTVQTVLAADGRAGRRGGIASYDQVKRELIRLCREHPNEIVTTMIDRSPELNTGLECVRCGTVEDVASSLELAIEADINLPNLVMNFELHEFEAYLYCVPEAFKRYGRKAPGEVEAVVRDAGGPEHINTDLNRLPSKRLNSVVPGYTMSKKIHTQEIRLFGIEGRLGVRGRSLTAPPATRHD